MYKECRSLAIVQYEQHISQRNAKMERKKNEQLLQVREKWGRTLLFSNSQVSRYNLVEEDEEVMYTWWLG